VAVDGVSLTVARRMEKSFSVALIQHTGDMTILLKKHSGNPVNIECDCIGKYVEQLMGRNDRESGLTMAKLSAIGITGGYYGK